MGDKLHLFMLSDERPGELMFRWQWLPYWVVTNVDIMGRIKGAAARALPPDLNLEELTDAIMSEIDAEVIKEISAALPYMVGLNEVLEAIVDVNLDASKVPRRIGKDGKALGAQPPTATPPE